MNKPNFDNFVSDYIEIHNRNIRVSGETSEYFSEYKVKEIMKWFSKNRKNYLRPRALIKTLDVGCGLGKTEAFWPQYFPGQPIYGIDVSKESVIVAKSKAQAGASFCIYDGTEFPYRDDSFNIVLVLTVLHHIDIKLQKHLLQEIMRVLVADGLIFIFEHNLYNPLTRHVVRSCIFDRGAQMLRKREVEKLLSTVGFKVIDGYYIVFFPRVLKFLRGIEPYLGGFPLGGQYVVVGTK